MLGSAMRVRVFRRENGLTQEHAATLFDVDVRSIRRWEAGASLPAEVQARIRADNRLTERMVEGAIAIVRHSVGMMVLLDDELVVIENSSPHKQRMGELFGIDIVGHDWHRYMTPETLNWLRAHGGVEGVRARGFIHGAFPYRRKATTLPRA